MTIFGIKVNSIATAVKNGVFSSLFMDDFILYYSGANMIVIERQLQLSINQIHRWSVLNGFKFSNIKTVCMHFCLLHSVQVEPKLTLNGEPIKVVEEIKFLGLIFDATLSFMLYIKHLKTQCVKTEDILRVLSSSRWGADRDVVLSVY